MSNIYEIIETLDELRTEMPDEKIIELFEKKVLNIKNEKVSYYFAKDVKGADIKAHQQVIIDSAIARTDTIECKQVSSESNCYNKVKRLMNLLNQATDN